ncbi:MAG: nuclear transport factor 2 family protein [Sphaerochaetaceae bacterium]|nr:nuclear transport factor 2 family protein [Sphaerochaetaceae bacterium]
MDREHNLPLTSERIRTLWSMTYNTHGKPDWSHLYPHYHDDIRFQDAIQQVSGKPQFRAMCDRLAKRCTQLDMELHTVLREGSHAILEWTMTMRFRRFPSSPIHGCSVLMIDDDELITSQRDYYDLWGDIQDKVPLWNRFYRLCMRKFFG